MNQASSAVRTFAIWRAYQDAESYDTIKASTGKVRPALMKIYAENGRLRATGEGESDVYLKFVLSLDKPAHCAVTGRRGLGFDFFSPFCGCAHSLNQLYRHDLGTRHYDWRSFKRCCALAGLALHEVLPNQRHDENWTLEIDEFDLATRKDTKKASACPSASAAPSARHRRRGPPRRRTPAPSSRSCGGIGRR